MPRDDEACLKNREKIFCIESKRNDDTYTDDDVNNLVSQEIIKELESAEIQSDCKEHFKVHVDATNDYNQGSTYNYFKRLYLYDDCHKSKTEDYLEPISCDYLEPIPTNCLKPECKYFPQTLREDSSQHQPDHYLQTIKKEIHSTLYNYTPSEIKFDLKQQNINDNFIQPRIDEDYHQLHGRSKNNVHSKSDSIENNQVMRNKNIDDYCALFSSNKIDDMSLTVMDYYIIHIFFQIMII